MAASRALLESLLARVRQRAAEPRFAASVAAPSVRPEPVVAEASGSRPAATLVADDEIEEYDEELIEIIDDVDDVDMPSDRPPEIQPLQLSASVPSVEMRRRVVPPANAAAPGPVAPAFNLPPPANLRPATAAPPSVRPPSVRGFAQPPAPAAPLRPEALPRNPLPVTQVVQVQGAPRELRSMSFVDLLDASLDLGR